MGAFVWNEAGTDAEFRPNGEENARGTSHDVPTATQCGTCHNGEAGRALGFSALQLSQGGGLDALAEAELLSHPPSAGEEFSAPGDAPTSAALGYLHANCGHCHNPNGSARPDTNMNLRLDIGQTSPESTNAYLTTLGVELQYFDDTELVYRVAPGEPERSALIERMRERGSETQMPPFATELVHDEGVAVVTAWIRSLGD
jgi:mono/diheme cytochrome c family protein